MKLPSGALSIQNVKKLLRGESLNDLKRVSKIQLTKDHYYLLNYVIVQNIANTTKIQWSYVG